VATAIRLGKVKGRGLKEGGREGNYSGVRRDSLTWQIGVRN
jgi:hypothetical protein